MSALTRSLFLYDDDCRFCRASARLVARLDNAGRFSFLPMRDERAVPFAALVPDSERFRSFHVIEPGGRAYSTGSAAIVMLSTIRVTSWLGKLLDALHLLWLVNLTYGAVARSRGFVGRFVRDAPGPVRWP